MQIRFLDNIGHNIKNNFLEYHRVTSCVKAYCKKIKAESQSHSKPVFPFQIRILTKFKSGSKDFYTWLKSHEDNISLRYSYWEQSLNIEISKSVWNQIFKNCFKTVKDNDLIWLQYRILNRIVGTKDYLFKINRNNDRTCSFCNKEVETIMHLFVNCEEVPNFWSELEKDIRLNLDINLVTTPYNIILGQNMIGSLGHLRNVVYIHL